MDDTQRLTALRIVLIAVGLIAVFAIWPLMIVGIYATLGVFLLIASRDPLQHLSLIWFTVWSSVVHGAIMAVQSFGVGMDGEHQFGHLLGDVPALCIVAAALAFFTPRGVKAIERG